MATVRPNCQDIFICFGSGLRVWLIIYEVRLFSECCQGLEETGEEEIQYAIRQCCTQVNGSVLKPKVWKELCPSADCVFISS